MLFESHAPTNPHSCDKRRERRKGDAKAGKVPPSKRTTGFVGAAFSFLRRRECTFSRRNNEERSVWGRRERTQVALIGDDVGEVACRGKEFTRS